jgi:hypothetical protein
MRRYFTKALALWSADAELRLIASARSWVTETIP